MTYHGGPVQHTQKIFTIFWAPPPYSFPSGFQSTNNQFVQDLNGSSYYGIASQYNDSVGFISTTALFGGTWFDITNPFPSNSLGFSDLLAEDGLADVVGRVRRPSRADDADGEHGNSNGSRGQ